MGKNKLSKFAELETFSHVFQVSSRELFAGKEFELKGKWHSDYFKNNNPIVLELGCGKGEYTVELAKANPNKNYIGIDIKGARLWKGAKEIAVSGIKNAAFIRTDIEAINYLFATNEIDEIWLTFPDPQMKKVTRRLTATNFIYKYSQILKPQGFVHLKTDSDFMFTYTKAMIEVNNLEVIECYYDLYDELPAHLPQLTEIKTYYERQWLDRGLKIKYIQFRLNNIDKLVEPNIEIEPDSYRSFKRERRVQ